MERKDKTHVFGTPRHGNVLRMMRWFLLSFLCVFASPAYAEDGRLSGKAIGSFPNYNFSTGNITTVQSGTTCAFDDQADTYFAASQSSMGWVGMDLGERHVITKIGVLPRQSTRGAEAMVLGIFEGANDPSFQDAVPLQMIYEQPLADMVTYYQVSVSRGFRYVRYVGPADTHCAVAQLEFYGYASAGDDSRFFQLTEVPTVSIHTVDDVVPTIKGVDCASHISIIYEGGTLIQEWPVKTRVRGNYSATHENKPYRFKIDDDGKSHHIFKGSPKDESPAKAKKWNLINNYGDKTLMRNRVAFEVSRRVGMEYTPFCRMVDVMLNGEYRGSYQLTDWLGVDPNRVDIVEMMPSDVEEPLVSGGYFFEMNGYAGSDPVNFTSSHGNPVTVHSPDDDAIQPRQLQYLTDWFNDMESRLFAAGYTNPTEGYRSRLDLDSFLKYFLANEFSGNTDMLWQVFMWKNRGDDLIYTGPVWDNDLALDNDYNVYPGNEREDWTYTVRAAGRWGKVVSRVLSDPVAMERLRQIWADLRDRGLFDAADLGAYVDSLRGQIATSSRLNFMRWPYLQQQVHCNPAVWGSWDKEVDVMRDYVMGRVAWMDRKLGYNVPQLVDGVYQVGTAGELVAISSLVRSGQTDICVALTADIDMTHGGAAFQPIGDLDHQFGGTFDGQGHTISHLHLQGTSFVGLFGVVQGGASIRNVMLDSTCTVSGNKYVGALIGAARAGTIAVEACGAAATVTATGEYSGGLVGGVPTAVLRMDKCFHAGHVSGARHAGTLLGYAKEAELTSCYNIGSIASTLSGTPAMAQAAILQMSDCFDTLESAHTTLISPYQATSGALCWLLNGEGFAYQWRQNLQGNAQQSEPDGWPVPWSTHAMVFATADGGYTNTNPNAPQYRYYMWAIQAVDGGSAVQVSEFDLIDQWGSEVESLSVYQGLCKYYNSGEHWRMVCDNRINTKWCGEFVSAAYLMFDAGETVSPVAYRIYTANDTHNYPDRNPMTWQLYGSDTRLTVPTDRRWRLIDDQSGNGMLPAADYTSTDFQLMGTGTGIGSVEMAGESHGVSGTYDLQGRRVQRMGQGVYVKDGRKILNGK